MNEENKAGSQNGTTQPEESGAAGKTFTQDEVNRIVSERLARDRANRNQTGGEDNDAAQQLQRREQAIAARENRLACREYLAANNLPEKLMDLFDTADAKVFQSKCETLQEYFPGFTVHRKTGMSHQNGSEVGGGKNDKIADAFRPPY